MDTESRDVWPLIGGLAAIVALIGLIEEEVLPGPLRHWLMLGVVLLGFGLLLTWEIRRQMTHKAKATDRTLHPDLFVQRWLSTSETDREQPKKFWLN